MNRLVLGLAIGLGIGLWMSPAASVASKESEALALACRRFKKLGGEGDIRGAKDLPHSAEKQRIVATLLLMKQVLCADEQFDIAYKLNDH